MLIPLNSAWPPLAGHNARSGRTATAVEEFLLAIGEFIYK